jgi:acyl-CoA synthetase (NDP forming)
MKADFSPIFSPQTVAVIGASEDKRKLGFHVMKSLLEGGFGGTVFPVNPSRKEVMGLRAYPSLEGIEENVDLAIVVVPATSVKEQIIACRRKGVRGIVLITAGFSEIDDPSGAALQEEIGRLATEAGIPIIGPNTFGLVNLHHGLNASFTPEFSLLKKGGVTLLSQSGGMSHLLAFLAMREEVGFSKIVGLGNRCNVDFHDILAWFVDDRETSCIALYLEGVDSARALWGEALSLRGKKPIVAYKCGRSDLGDRASKSHTGSLAGDANLYKGAMIQTGILWVEDSLELLDASKALASSALPKGERVAILSGQAGPAMAAMDVCWACGLKVEPFKGSTQEAIDELLPPLALRTNPVDMGPAWYDSKAIARIVETALLAEEVDLVLLLIMFASANSQAPRGLMEVLFKWKGKKPVLGCIMAPPGIWEDEVRELEAEGAMINFPTPERAAKAASFLCRWARFRDYGHL